MYDKMNRFLPPANDWSLETEFECWHPDASFAFGEPDGTISWRGAGLPAIEADGSLPFVDLPKQLQEMISHCWKKAVVPTSPRANPPMLGGARQQAFNNRGLQPGGPADQARVMAAGQYRPMVSPTTPPPTPPGVNADMVKHLQGVANDWNVMTEMKRVNAYTFRGDTRAPAAIKAAGGFNPPSTRNDKSYVEGAMFEQFSGYMKRRFNLTVDKQTFLDAYNKTVQNDAAKNVLLNFSIWKALTDQEAFHVGRMLANEALKGYISTTKAITVAKGFAKSGGWVFLTLVRGGFEIPDQRKHIWTAIFGEQEIALPSGLAWADIYGFRQVSPKGPKKFVGPIYFRKGFAVSNPIAFQKAHDLFSGQIQ
jgi:hypothetical protein